MQVALVVLPWNLQDRKWNDKEKRKKNAIKHSWLNGGSRGKDILEEGDGILIQGTNVSLSIEEIQGYCKFLHDTAIIKCIYFVKKYKNATIIMCIIPSNVQTCDVTLCEHILT